MPSACASMKNALQERVFFGYLGEVGAALEAVGLFIGAMFERRIRGRQTDRMVEVYPEPDISIAIRIADMKPLVG